MQNLYPLNYAKDLVIKMRIHLFCLILILITGCQPENENSTQLSEVTIYKPGELIRFDHTGSHYFSHLGYTSVVLDDGSVLLADREHKMAFKVTSTGDFLEIVASPGRGPGEIQDVSFISESFSGNVLLYDQINQKVITLDNLGQYVDEFTIPQWNNGNLTEVYKLNEQQYLFVFKSFEYLRNPDSDPEAYLVVYDRHQESYLTSKTISDKLYARHIVDGQLRGGRVVPYANDNLRGYNKNTGGLFLFWSGDNQIVQIDNKLDTLGSISLDVEPQSLTSAEVDTIREETNPDIWQSMKNLLPKQKALVDDLLIDHENNFWVKLNYVSDYQQWLIVSEEAEILQIVQLPKDAMLTHVSEDHLGVRLDNVTFSFFEPVQL